MVKLEWKSKNVFLLSLYIIFKLILPINVFLKLILPINIFFNCHCRKNVKVLEETEGLKIEQCSDVA